MPRRPDRTSVGRRHRDRILGDVAPGATEAARRRAETLVADVKKRKKRVAIDGERLSKTSVADLVQLGR